MVRILYWQKGFAMPHAEVEEGSIRLGNAFYSIEGTCHIWNKRC